MALLLVSLLQPVTVYVLLSESLRRLWRFQGKLLHRWKMLNGNQIQMLNILTLNMKSLSETSSGENESSVKKYFKISRKSFSSEMARNAIDFGCWRSV